MKTICFDIDGTICNNTWGEYEKAKPINKAVKKINEMYNKNFYIILFSARFTGKNNENLGKINKKGFDFTKKQLNEWGVKYHKLILGKPTYDILVDDKHLGYSEDWIDNDF